MKFNSKIRQAIAFNSDLHIISVLFCVIYINIFDYLDSLLSRLHVFNPVPASVDNWGWIIWNLVQRASLYGRYAAVPRPKSS